MPARPPVRSTNQAAASTFGPIEPAGRSSARSSSGAAEAIGVASGVPSPRETASTSVSSSSASPQPLREQRGRAVLVDHRFDAAQAPVAVDDDRDAAAADAHHQHARLDEQPDRRQLDDRARIGRRDDAAPVLAIGPDRPAALGAQQLLPEPDGPMIATISPRSTTRSTPSKARTCAPPSPKRLTRPWASIAGALGSLAGMALTLCP
jgi:hypothetical protein